MSLGNLMYSRIWSYPGVQVVVVGGKVPCYCSVGSRFNVKHVT